MVGQAPLRPEDYHEKLLKKAEKQIDRAEKRMERKAKLKAEKLKAKEDEKLKTDVSFLDELQRV